MHPVLALIIANIIWGAAPPIFKLAFQSVPPFVLAFLRFYIAAFLLIPYVKKVELGKISYRTGFLILLGSVTFVFHITFFFLGLKYAPSINASIISTASPIFLYFLSIFILKEPSRPRLLTGMIIGTIGVLVIILSPVLAGSGKMAAGEITGNIFYVISIVMELAYTVLFKQLLTRLSVITVTAGGFFIAAALFLPLAVQQSRTWNVLSITSVGIAGVLFGALICSLFAYYLFYWGIKRIPAEEIGLYTYIDPVVTVMVAIPLLHEYPDQFFVIGSMLVFAGIFIAEGRIHWHPVHKLLVVPATD